MSDLPQNPWRDFLATPGEATFASVYNQTRALVWTLCVRILGNYEDAHDAFQDTWSRLLAEVQAGQFPGNGAIIGADGEEVCRQGLYRLAVREAQNLRRRRARRAGKEVAVEILNATPSSEPGANELAAQRQLREQIETMVRLLPEDCRLPVALHLFHGLSQEQIGNMLGAGQSTISRRIARGLRRLERLLRRAGLAEALPLLTVLGGAEALLAPPEALCATAVYAQAQAALTAAGAGVAGAGLGSLSAKLSCGVMMMKTKTALVAGLTALGLTVLVASNEIHKHAEVHAARLGPTGTIQSAIHVANGSPSSGAAEGAEEHSVTASRRVMNSSFGPSGGLATTMSTMKNWSDSTTATAKATIIGRVIDAETRRPVANAEVQLSAAIKGRSDWRGFYSIAGVDVGQLDIVASAKGYANRPAIVNAIQEGRTVQNFELDPAIDIHVQVTDRQGAPIEGVIIEGTDIREGFIDRVGTTDVRGQAVVPRMSRLKPPTLSARKAGYREVIDDRGKIAINANRTRGDVRIVLETIEDMDRVIQGVVKDSGGNPVPLVTVQWSPIRGRQEGRDKTLADENGRYRLAFRNEEPTCKLSVYGEGWAPVIREGVISGTPDRPAQQDFILEPGHWLAGRVIDEEGKPVKDARLEVMPEWRLLHEWSYPGVTRRTRTDAEGRFRLEDISGPTVAVALRGPGDDWTDGGQDKVAVDREITLTLKRSGAIVGRVMDKASGLPIPTFTVKTLGGGILVTRINPGETFNSPRGEFVLKDLDQGLSYDLTIEAPGYLVAERKEIPAESRTKATQHEIRLSRGRDLTGYLYDAETKALVKGAKVTCGVWSGIGFSWSNIIQSAQLLNGQQLTVGSDGRFAFKEDELITVFVNAEGYRPVVIRPAERGNYQITPQCLMIPLKRGETLSGTAWQNGRPASIPLLLFRVGEGASALVLEALGEIKVAEDGRFTRGGLTPGRYQLLSIWRLPEELPQGGVNPYRTFEIKEGKPAQVDFGDDLGPYIFKGRVLDDQGRPLDNVCLTLRPTFPWSYAKFESYISAELSGARFAFPHLKPGRYQVEITSKQQKGKSVALPPMEITGNLECELRIESDRLSSKP